MQLLLEKLPIGDKQKLRAYQRYSLIVITDIDSAPPTRGVIESGRAVFARRALRVTRDMFTQVRPSATLLLAAIGG